MERNFEVEEIVVNFKEYLEETGINENKINYKDVNCYLTLLHYDLLDEYGSENAQLVEEEIENVIYENFKITND